MSSLRKQSQGYRWPIENTKVVKTDGPLDGPVVVYATEEVLKDLNRFWQPKAKDLVTELWNTGKSYGDINIELQKAGFGRNDDDELLLCVMDLFRSGKIQQRDSGIWGVVYVK